MTTNSNNFITLTQQDVALYLHVCYLIQQYTKHHAARILANELHGYYTYSAIRRALAEEF